MFKQILHILGISNESSDEEEVEDKISILNSSELNCIKNICSVIEEDYLEPAYRAAQDEDEAYSAALKMSSLEGDLGNIVRNLLENSAARQHFKDVYPEWKNLRKKTIKKLKKIADSINSDRKKYNWWRLTGFGVSFIGGGLTLASLCAISLKKGISSTLSKAGLIVVATAIGGLIGTSFLELKSLKENVDEATEIIKNDKERFKEMKNWLKCAYELEDILSKILNIDHAKEIIEDVQKLIENLRSITQDERQLSFIREELKVIIQKLPRELQTPVKIILVGTMIPIVATLILINIKNRFVFDISQVTIKSFVTLFPHVNDLRLGLTDEFGTYLRKVPLRAFAAFGMAMDFVGIVVTSADIRSGSKSKHAEMITKASEEMSKELVMIAKVYATLDKTAARDVGTTLTFTNVIMKY